MSQDGQYLATPGREDRAPDGVNDPGGTMRRWFSLAGIAGLAIVLSFAASGCGGSSKSGGGGGAVKALPPSSCQPLEYKGDGDPDYLIATDLPMQGGSRTQTTQMVKAVRYLLDQQDWKAGDYKIAFQACDDSTAQLGKWDPDKCSRNTHAYASDAKLLGVIGTF